MAVNETGNIFCTGKTGSGKTLYAVQKINDYLLQGRRVVTNLDINLEKLLPSDNNMTITRVPDMPRSSDLLSIGYGYDRKEGEKLDKSRYGLIVLDECSTWLNRRAWNDKDRLKLINWFVQIRKYRWNSIFLAQSLDVIDANVVNQLLHYHVSCRNLETVYIPFFQHFGLKLPSATVARKTSGTGKGAVAGLTETYKGKHLYEVYDTEQEFHDGFEPLGHSVVDMRSVHTVLSAAYHSRSQAKDIKQVKEINPDVLQLLKAVNTRVHRSCNYQTIWER